ncbi:MAG: alanyl-tRNA editing protein [Burkholderiales bacterium]
MMVELLYRDDPYLKACEATVVAARDGAVALDRTVFYAMGGGQPGDSGSLTLEDGRSLRVVDTRRDSASDEVLHLLAPEQALPATGARLRAEIDWTRRHRHMRLHTALHLLCAVVRAPVTGGRIAEDKAHLDFDIEMEKLVKAEIESGVNALVDAGHRTRTLWVSDAELDARPDLVKTMSVAPPRGEGRVRLLEIPGVDLQACGGTHVADTREIGALVVARIRSEGRRNRRVTLAVAQ